MFIIPYTKVFCKCISCWNTKKGASGFLSTKRWMYVANKDANTILQISIKNAKSFLSPPLDLLRQKVYNEG